MFKISHGIELGLTKKKKDVQKIIISTYSNENYKWQPIPCHPWMPFFFFGFGLPMNVAVT